MPGSPAIDAGTTGCPPTPATDQRGVSRPQGGACDMGSFELQGGAPTVTPTMTPTPPIPAAAVVPTLARPILVLLALALAAAALLLLRK